MATATIQPAIHEGRNIRRFREMQGIKQEALALILGDDWNQKKISVLESKKMIEPLLLEKLAKALRIPVEALKQFDDETTVTIISDSVAVKKYDSHPGINPLEKIVELYERLLKEKDEIIDSLRKK